MLRLARLDVSLAHELPNCREYRGCLGHFGLVYHSKVIVSILISISFCMADRKWGQSLVSWLGADKVYQGLLWL